MGAIAPRDLKPATPPTLTGDVAQRIVAAIKIFDEGMNRKFIGEPGMEFEDFTEALRWAESSLTLWICVQELLTQKDHLSHAHLISEWTRHMIVKWFVYKYLDKKRWPDTKALLITYRKFLKRTTPFHLRTIRDHFKPAENWNMPYWNQLKKIWSIDPNLAQNVWKEVFPD